MIFLTFALLFQLFSAFTCISLADMVQYSICRLRDIYAVCFEFLEGGRSFEFRDLGTRGAFGCAWQGVRGTCVRDDLLVFDLNGKIRMARSCEGKHRAGDSIRAHMTAAEWEYLRKNCLSYECARILVNTREGAMLVFCNMLASMHIMIGVILHADREAVAYYCQRHITMVDRVSPCLAVPRRVTPPSDEQLSQIDELLSLSFSAFATAGVRNELGRSILGATSYIIRRICFLARRVGCCVNCRSVREFAPRVEDFNGDAFVAMMLHLFFFVYD